MKEREFFGARARRSLGQNFLVAGGVAERIVEALELVPGELVFEIGPGRGALTKPLAASGARVVAFEIDEDLAQKLRSLTASMPNVEIVRADIREVDLDEEAQKRSARHFKLIGNIPYHLTSSILLALPGWRKLTRASIMVQKEVGERISAVAGSRLCGMLSIFLQSYFIINKVLSVRPGSFSPPPKVMSVVLDFTPLNPPQGPADRESFLRFLKACFGQRRKKIKNILASAFPATEQREEFWARVGIDSSARPEALSLREWLELYEALGAALGRKKP